jgi:hypothetical protein
MKTSVSLLSAWWLLWIIPALAGPKDFPEGPLILKAPEYAAWSMTLVNASNPMAPAGSTVARTPPLTDRDRTSVIQWNFRKAKDVTYVQCVTKGGGSVAVWVVGGMQVVQIPGRKSCYVSRHMPLAVDPFWIEPGPNGYPHTEIVSKSTYQDIESFLGQPCLVFKKRVHDPVELDPSLGNYDIIVYVDEKSRLPVFTVNRDDGYKFQFLKAPEVDLTPPPEVTNAIDLEGKRRARLDAVPPHA